MPFTDEEFEAVLRMSPEDRAYMEQLQANQDKRAADAAAEKAQQHVDTASKALSPVVSTLGITTKGARKLVEEMIGPDSFEIVAGKVMFKQDGALHPLNEILTRHPAVALLLETNDPAYVRPQSPQAQARREIEDLTRKREQILAQQRGSYMHDHIWREATACNKRIKELQKIAYPVEPAPQTVPRTISAAQLQRRQTAQQKVREKRAAVEANPACNYRLIEFSTAKRELEAIEREIAGTAALI